MVRTLSHIRAAAQKKVPVVLSTHLLRATHSVESSSIIVFVLFWLLTRSEKEKNMHKLSKDKGGQKTRLKLITRNMEINSYPKERENALVTASLN